MTTLQELYELYDAKTLSKRIIVAGADISDRVDELDYGFDVGQVATATFKVPNQLMVGAIAEEAEVEIWIGFRVGMTEIRALVFGDGIINSVSWQGMEAIIEVVQDGGRRLNFPYYKDISYNFDNVTAHDSVKALLDLAGVPNYVIDLDPWDIGTAVPQTLKFSSYGEAINKVSTVDGSPWFALPSGQIRVEKRDPLPYDNPKRTYFSSELTGIAETPLDATRPRILNISKSLDRAGVNNFITVDGAVLVTLGPQGEQNSDQIVEEVDGAPGSFPNGAPWIPTPPLFQPFTYSNELIDTNAKANVVANRYYNLKNRLIENVSLSIPLDPLLFLCETIRVVDPITNTDDLYFLSAYRCSISGNQASSDLTLLGGPFSGTQGFAKPFAEFRWTYSPLWNRIGGNKEVGTTGCAENASKLNNGYGSNLAAKLCQDMPENTGSPDQGGNNPSVVLGSVIIGLDATMSEDFDGSIVSYAWSDDQGHTGTGPRVTFIYDPETSSTVQMTLVVTDNTARTDTITKTISVGATAPPGPRPDDPTLDDTAKGGGAASGDCTDGGNPTTGGDGPGGKKGMAALYFIAAGCKAMGTKDNTDWNMIDKDDQGVGDFISVAASSDYDPGEVTALFGTNDGRIMKTVDGVVTGSNTLDTKNRDEAILSIAFDTENCSTVWAATSKGQIFKSTNKGDSWTVAKHSDNKPINKMLIINGHLYVFGGDSSDINNMIRMSPNLDPGNLHPVNIGGQLATALRNAGPGHTIKTASLNGQKLLIGFDSGVTPLVATSSDPLHDPAGWTPATGITGSGIKSSAPGHDGHFLVSSDTGLFHTSNSEDFTAGATHPQNDLTWEGLPGVYMGVEDGKINKTTDEGDTMGDGGAMFPNAGVPGQTPSDWPACAIAEQVVMIVVPRPDTLWPSRPPLPTLLVTGLNNQSTNGAVLTGSYVLPNTGHNVLMWRLLNDPSGVFDVVSDTLSWSILAAGPTKQIAYCIVSAVGQTVNYTVNNPAPGPNFIGYTADVVKNTGGNIGSSVGAGGTDFVNTVACNTTFGGGCDFVVSFGDGCVAVAPLNSIPGSGGQVCERLGPGACNWTGFNPGEAIIGNVGFTV